MELEERLREVELQLAVLNGCLPGLKKDLEDGVKVIMEHEARATFRWEDHKKCMIQRELDTQKIKDLKEDLGKSEKGIYKELNKLWSWFKGIIIVGIIFGIWLKLFFDNKGGGYGKTNRNGSAYIWHFGVDRKDFSDNPGKVSLAYRNHQDPGKNH